MRTVRRVLLTAGLLAGSVPLAPLSAQLEGDAEVSLSSAYLWRGLMQANRPVVFVELAMAGSTAGLELAAGADLTVEPSRYGGARDISLTAHRPAPSIGDATFWAELAVERGPLTITAGSLAYLYPEERSLNLAAATVEAYGLVTLDAALSPSLGIYADIGQVGGAYLEAGLESALALPASIQLELAGTAGLSVAQPDYFARDGMTHAGVSAGLLREWGSLRVRPALVFSTLLDPATRLVEPEREARTHLSAALAIGWSMGGD